MERSGKCLTLSGLSGVLAGIYALIGGVIAHRLIYTSQDIVYHSIQDLTISKTMIQLGFLGAMVLVSTLLTGFYFSYRKAQKMNISIWNKPSRKFLFNMAIPLAIGAFFMSMLVLKGHADLLAASCLIFYGLALYNAGHFTYSDVQKLGLTEILLGCAALMMPSMGLYFWMVGFGLLHIVYGAIMYYKYDR